VRKLFTFLGVVSVLAVLVVQAPIATGATAVRVAADSRVTNQRYVRHDGGTDATIDICNSEAAADYGNNTVDNEPFSVVDPSDPNLVVAGWNDYCSDWMGLGISTDGGRTWFNSLVPGYPADTSAEGMASPEYIRTNNASDPVAAFDRTGRSFYVGFVAYNGNAGPKTNSDMAIARYAVVDPATNHGYPLDYLGTVRVGEGPPAANFKGRFNDKDMVEVDRTAGRFDGNVYACWTKFPSAGSTTIMFSRSIDRGATFSKPIGISGRNSGQGCDIAIEHDGDVYVSWRDIDTNSSNSSFGISAARSSDGGTTFAKIVNVATFTGYNPFDGARDCGDGLDACQSGFVFSRVPLEPRLTADPTGRLPGVFSVFQAADPSTIVAAQGSYSSAGAGVVGQGAVYVSRSTNDGATWSAPVRVSRSAVGHQFFPDADALNGTLAVAWQDSRTDPAYSVQRPIGNTATATSSGTNIVNTYVATSTDGVSFGSAVRASTSGNQPQYEMFDSASVPFYGDYNWIQLVQRGTGLGGYLVWTDNRDVVAGLDPREATQDGFDTLGCWVQQPDGSYLRTCFNGGGYDQNIYGASISL
jgi:hypothetical protein